MDLHSPLRHEGRLVVSDRVIAIVTAASLGGAVIGAWPSLQEGALLASVGGALIGSIVAYFLTVQGYLLATAVWHSPLPRLCLACAVLVLVLGLIRVVIW